MSLTVFLAVIGAALLHASWNALVKLGGSKMTGMLILSMVQGLIGAVLVFAYPMPEGQIWLWLVGSAFLHSAYKFLLAFAYAQGDLSRVYPIARGAAPMIVLGFGAVFLADHIRGIEVVGILTLGIGVSLMARGVFTSGETRRLLPFAIGSAIATASYSIVDGLGARLASDAGQFVAWVFLFDGVIFASVAALGYGKPVFRADRRMWALGSVAALASYGAYAIAVWAMTLAPIALVTALRETSILFAVLIGWLIFGERMDRPKVIAACLIVGGVILTRL